MSDLYVAVLEISADRIRKRINRKINSNSVYKYDGFEFRVLYSDEEYFQLSIYAYNTGSTQFLFNSMEESGTKAGGKFNVPIMIETDGGFAGDLCTYILVVSRNEISLDRVYQFMGINENWKVTSQSYRKFKEYLQQFERTTGFSELMHYIEKEKDIHEKTNQMIAGTKVYNEHFFSTRNPEREGIVKFKEDLTLLSAKEAVMRGKRTTILNFANPVECGGGVLRGAKAQEENIVVIDEIKLDAIKTKPMASFLKAVGADTKALVVTAENNDVVVKSAANIPGVEVTFANLINVYDILNAKKLVVDKAALAKIEEVFA